MPARESKQLLPFLRKLYIRLGGDDLKSRGPENLLGAAQAVLSFARRRRRGAAKIRIYDPDMTRDGWASPNTVIEIVNDDMPFLVDSLSALLESRAIPLRLIVHPILAVRRDARGRLLEIADTRNAPSKFVRAESIMQVEVESQDDAAKTNLARALAKLLREVRAVVSDWQAMRDEIDAALREIAANKPPVRESEIAESIAFLEWLRDNHFTFQGARDYTLLRKGGRDFLRPIPGSGLGLLRKVSREAAKRHKAPLSPAVAAFNKRRELLIIAKATTPTLVHRAVPLDFIGVRRFSPGGEVVGQRRIVGLFTSLAYSQSPRYIPILRDKIAGVIARAGLDPNSHDGKSLLHILETYPRDEIFQASEDDLFAAALGILRLQERRRIALFVRRDPFEWHVSCLVFVPRERYSNELKERFQSILTSAFAGLSATCDVQVSEGPLARLHCVIQTKQGAVPACDIRALERELVEAARTWRDRLAERLSASIPAAEARAILDRYCEAFPPGYRHRYAAPEAIFDIARLEEVRATGRTGVHLCRDESEGGIRLKLYRPAAPAPLSEILPILENMGFRVVAERPFEVKPLDMPQPLWIQELAMESGEAVDCARFESRFRETFLGVLEGVIEDDGYNRLVVSAGLAWREALALRAYGRFLRQAGMPWSDAYVQATLDRNAGIAALLFRLFAARFDPDRRPSRGFAAALAADIEKALDAVPSADEDRILRRFYNLVAATVRTNFFQRGEGDAPKPYLSFKFESRRIDDLPAPKPLYEIFVYSAETEGVHLRGGPIARGGIRWSDRREDFRTEILGLMKAQTVKNAVIVPVGAKGGFVVKRQDPARTPAEQGIACYRTLMRGMLDITDNLVRGKPVSPERVVRHDGDDPYLVVAADKGTASFSDIANAVAADYGFWLGDAFASGGSAGYDHKKMGITARGVWESVKRHFREMGRNAEREAITVVGVGDMSGDVFGNGLLLSRNFRLVAAFDHRHIFVDPDPDARRSHAERARLFKLPRSSWADYDRRRISRGGGVFDRGAKSIRISPEMRALFAIAGDAAAPAALIRAILCADVDLLWFGGIGTFVRASDETDAEVGDRANDQVRVAGRDLRARVVAEGANLAVSQRGRVEYAACGGRLNTDAIDNSAGVDCSDHEVNIKILLNTLESAGSLARRERNALLARVSGETAALVLRDNYLQTQAISLHEARAFDLLDRDARLMRALEKQGRLERALESLPDDEELAERGRQKKGLTRPEIAVLLAHAKLALHESLVKSDLADDPLLRADLKRYFPRRIAERAGPAIFRHPLRREIITTFETNSLVNRMGAGFMAEVEESSGAQAADIVRAYAVTRDVFALRELWGGVEGLDGRVPASVQTAMMIAISALAERAVAWLLARVAPPLSVSRLSAALRPGVKSLARKIEGLLVPAEAEKFVARANGLAAERVPVPLARAVAALPFIASALDIVGIAKAASLDVSRAARIYFAAGARFRLAELRERAAAIPPASPWQRQAAAALVNDLYAAQADLVLRVIEAATVREPEAALSEWAAKIGARVARTEQTIAEIMNAPTLDLSMIAVANRALRALVRN